MASPAPVEPPKKSGSVFFKLVKILFFLFLLLVIAFIFVGMVVLDGKYELSRETTIKAKPEDVHKQVGDLDQWPNWLPFQKQDPSVKTTVVQAKGVGANQSWTSNNGNGKLNFTKSDEQKGVEFDMLFDEKYPAKGTISYEKVGDDTKVTWKMVGQNNDFMGKWMALAMQPMMGPMFETGLADLKAKVEAK